MTEPDPAHRGRVPARADAPGIELDQVTKVYPGRTDEAGMPIPSVDALCLTVPRGQVLGLLGRNGAGKSTTIRLITTLLRPTSGTVRVCGMDTVQRQAEVRALLGVALGGERSVYWKLTGRQNLEYFLSLQGRTRRRSRGAIDRILSEVGLAERADDHVENYSTGMRQRLVIARALLNNPQVLLLDEPVSGLDPRAAEDLHDQIRRLKAEGHTILLATHDMAEADALSDRIAVIEAGRIVAEGTPIELKRSLAIGQVLRARVQCPDPERARSLVAELGATAGMSGERAAIGDASVEASITGSTDADLLPRLIDVAARHDGIVVRVDNELAGLKEVFLSVVADQRGTAT